MVSTLCHRISNSVMLTTILNNKIPLATTNLSSAGYMVSLYESVADIQQEWDGLALDNVAMHSDFLLALEAAPPSGTQYRYAVVRREGNIIGITYWQLKTIDLYRSLRLDVYQAKNAIDKIWHWIKSLAARPLKAFLLVNGNMTLTGNHGSTWISGIDRAVSFSLIDQIADLLIANLRKQGIKVRAVLIKDFLLQEKISNVNDWAFTEFQVQPNMIVEIDSTWKTFDDYINGMKSKYRVRVRRARKKSDHLVKKTLSLADIKEYEDKISALYQNVADQAGFNLFILPQNYFYRLQKHLGDKMKVIGYFDGPSMVGFSSSIRSHGDLDAHFLGYDPECNKESQLYLNMLYDLVEDAIAFGAKNLIMSRTAMEIKSSVGAEPHDMYLYLKSPSTLINKGVAKGLSFFKPDTDWQPRSPFK